MTHTMTLEEARAELARMTPRMLCPICREMAYGSIRTVEDGQRGTLYIHGEGRENECWENDCMGGAL